jgi:hypothetical protein
MLTPPPARNPILTTIPPPLSAFVPQRLHGVKRHQGTARYCVRSAGDVAVPGQRQLAVAAPRCVPSSYAAQLRSCALSRAA